MMIGHLEVAVVMKFWSHISWHIFCVVCGTIRSKQSSQRRPKVGLEDGKNQYYMINGSVISGSVMISATMQKYLPDYPPHPLAPARRC